MSQNRNPLHKRGSRNVFCPYYRNCLDHAANNHWQSWACFSCQHEKDKEPSPQGPLPSYDTIPYYQVSPEIYFKD
jgi:hypothetical protein